MAVETHDFREALGHFATGVTVITTRGPGNEPVGITANSFNSVSLDPPLILFSLARSAFSLAAFTNHRHFAVNILKEGQEALSDQFAVASGDKWSGVSHDPGDTGCPILEGSLASFECRIRNTYHGGDHLILVGEVLRLSSESSGRPLMFHQGRYAALKGAPQGA